MKKIAEYKISVVSPEDYKDIVPHDFANDLTGGFALKDSGIAFVKDFGDPELNAELVDHELQELLAATSPHELDGVRYGWLSDIGEAIMEPFEEAGQWIERTFLPEDVKQTISDIPILGDTLSRGWLGPIGQQMTNEGKQYAEQHPGFENLGATASLAAPLITIFGPAILPFLGEVGSTVAGGLSTVGGGLMDMLGLGGAGGRLSSILQSILGGGGGTGTATGTGGGTTANVGGGGNSQLGDILSALLGGQGKANYPNLPTARNIFDEAMSWANEKFPQAYGARESALSDIAKGNEYYAGFQPTSIEQALADKSFADMLEKTQRQTSHLGSLTGMESQIPYQFAKAMGPTTVSIGEYLSNLGQTRATNSLNSRLGINPSTIYNPYAETTGDLQLKQYDTDVARNVAGAQSDALRNATLGGYGGDILSNIMGGGSSGGGLDIGSILSSVLNMFGLGNKTGQAQPVNSNVNSNLSQQNFGNLFNTGYDIFKDLGFSF